MSESGDPIRVMHVNDEAGFADVAAEFLGREDEALVVDVDSPDRNGGFFPLTRLRGDVSTIRAATEEDIEAIRDIAEAAWYAGVGGTLDPAAIAEAVETCYDPEIVAAGVEADSIAFYVAEIEGENGATDGKPSGGEPTGEESMDEGATDGESTVVGFASAERTWADEVELHTVYVHPDRWGEGVGAALLDEVAAWARAEGADRIACGVLADNAVGVDFFEAVGFRRGRKTEAEIAGSVREEYEYELSI